MDLPSVLWASACCSHPDTLNALTFFSAAAGSPVVGLNREQMEVSRGVEAIRGFLAPSSGVCSFSGFVAVVAHFFFHLGSVRLSAFFSGCVLLLVAGSCEMG